MTSEKTKNRTMLRVILALSLPSIVTNITTPLLGMTDVAIAGHMGSAVYIGAIAVGSNMFNMLYWLLGFLRMGSSGMTAQAYGAGDRAAQSLVLARSLLLAVGIGMVFVVFQRPLCRLLLSVMDVNGATATLCRDYFYILVWGAPASLGSYALTGWLLGMQNTRVTMWVSLIINLVNISVSLAMVYWLGMGISGLAIGSLTAQWVGMLMALGYIVMHFRPQMPRLKEVISGEGLSRYFRVNSDIFLRTVCLVGVTVWFTRVGASQGAVMLAVNALLMQLFTLFSYFMDGFAFAGEAVCGRLKGAGDRDGFKRAVRVLFATSGSLAMIFTLVYMLCGDGLLRLLSNDATVIQASADYFLWAVSIPLAGFIAFTADGICIGVTRTRLMLISVAIASAVYFAVYITAFPTLHNHGLWLAFVAYLVVRGIVLVIGLRVEGYSPFSAR